MQHEPAFESSRRFYDEEVRVVPITSYNWLTDFPSREALDAGSTTSRTSPGTCPAPASLWRVVDDLIEAQVPSRREAHPQLE